jgi:hypothetical protein
MAQAQLTRDREHERTLADLPQLTLRNDLPGQVEAFLLACKVEDLSPATVTFYRQTVTHFLRFLCQSGDLRGRPGHSFPRAVMDPPSPGDPRADGDSRQVPGCATLLQLACGGGNPGQESHGHCQGSQGPA